MTWQIQMSKLSLIYLSCSAEDVRHGTASACDESQCGAELHMSMLTTKWMPTEAAVDRFASSARRAQIGVAMLSLSLLRPTDASSGGEGGDTKGSREEKTAVVGWARLPLLSPMRLRLSLETHTWHGASNIVPSIPATSDGIPIMSICRFVELKLSHICMRISPQHIHILQLLWRATGPAVLSTPRHFRSQPPTVAPVEGTSTDDVSPSQSIQYDDSTPSTDLPLTDQLSQHFVLQEAAGGRPGVQRVAHSASGGSIAWLAWRYAVPHAVRRFVIDTSSRVVPRAINGALCELRSWDVVNEKWVLWAAAPLRREGEGWKAELLEPRGAQGAWEWQVHSERIRVCPPPHPPPPLC